MYKVVASIALFVMSLTLGPAVVAAEPATPDAAGSKKNTVRISSRIDTLVEAKLADLGQKRNPAIDDETFVRRIYLDVVGRIPTLEETEAFLDAKNANKRARLIDELLDSYGFVSHQFNYWADVLRVKTRSNRVQGAAYINFLKDSLESNQPYDEFVRELLTAEGDMLEPGNGAVGYYLRDIDMPEDNMSNTIRVFLGTRLECAQCHDHPFDVWTQRDYFEMVAFTGGMKYKKNGYQDSLSKADREKLKKFQTSNPKEYSKLRNFFRSANMGVYGSGTSLAKLPEGYMGSDGDEGEVVTGVTMFDRQPLVDSKIPEVGKGKKRFKKKKRGSRIPGAVDLGSRYAYAKWLTSPDNSRFSTVIANRLWKQAMGAALIEPVDTIDDGTRASNEPLMEYLAETTVDLGFDRKALLRAIYNSRTYQSGASETDVKDVTTYGFNGPLLRRMSAEQLWDSLLSLTIAGTDQRAEAKSYGGRQQGQLLEMVQNGDDYTLDEVIKVAQTTEKNIKKADKMRDSKRRQLRAKSKEKLNVISAEIKLAKRLKDDRRVRDLMAKRVGMVSKAKGKSRGSKLLRASEMSSPSPAGHFLREFGQSDREQIENANTEPAVTQVLSMMNGMIDKAIAKDMNSALMANVLEADPGDVVDIVFMSMLSRHPTREESKSWAGDFKSDPRMAYTDLIWTLANSNEFIFVK